MCNEISKLKIPSKFFSARNIVFFFICASVSMHFVRTDTSFSCFLLRFVSFLQLKIVIQSYVQSKKAVIYFPYCACAPLQKNIFDRIRGTYLFKQIDRMCIWTCKKNKTKQKHCVKRSREKFLLILFSVFLQFTAHFI